MTILPPVFESIDGNPHFMGIRVEQRSCDVAGITYTLAGLKDAADLLDKEDFAKRFIEEDVAPYGMELWPASHMLCAYIAAGESGNGRRALDLGCGLGLASIVATGCGWQVTACDNDETSLRFALHNADLNNVSVSSFEVIDWHHPPVDRTFDRIFGADILYQLVDHEPILNLIDCCLTTDGLAVISDPNRGVADRLPDLARARGFDVHTQPAAPVNHQGITTSGRVFTLRRS